MKIGICFSGLMRTFYDDFKLHVGTRSMIDDLRLEFDDVVVVGLTDAENSYPPKKTVVEQDIFNRTHTEFDTNNEKLREIGFDQFVIDDKIELNAYLDSIPKISKIEWWNNREHAIGQYWKHKKCTEMIPDRDVYVKLRWDVRISDTKNIIDNIKYLMNDAYNTGPTVLFYGLEYLPEKSSWFFKDFAPIISNKEAQTIFNTELKHRFNMGIQTTPEKTQGTTFWLDAYGEDCKISAPINNTYMNYNIQRPDWW